ncbi:MAG: hypothetical protein HPY74_15310 [Firmicutes bacterium]|nr:hypothetical protein [Bacillota bacterium]
MIEQFALSSSKWNLARLLYFKYKCKNDESDKIIKKTASLINEISYIEENTYNILKNLCKTKRTKDIQEVRHEGKYVNMMEISVHFNNKAFINDLSEFSGNLCSGIHIWRKEEHPQNLGHYFILDSILKEKILYLDKIKFLLPEYGKNDNIVCCGQKISVPEKNTEHLHYLGVAIIIHVII